MWQPLISAPKDGTGVLLYCPSKTLPNGYVTPAQIVVARWDQHYSRFGMGGDVSDVDDGGAFIAPLSDGFYRAVADEFSEPTHWMPLPSPPSV